MKIIKLDAIDSTNSFLKDLAQNSSLEDYTIVVTQSQTSGRGQMNQSWHSEPHKNLTFSIFTRFKNLQIEHQPYLNFAVSLAIFEVLESLSVPNLSIKWPNDIMSGTKKICGILIETTFTKRRIKNTVMGIGLNVNQTLFPETLPNASSLRLILQREFDLDTIMHQLINRIQSKIKDLEQQNFELIYEKYHQNLYAKNVPMAFKNEKTQLFFMGMIQGVATNGNLLVQLEDDSVVEFGIKEISLAKA